MERFWCWSLVLLMPLASPLFAQEDFVPAGGSFSPVDENVPPKVQLLEADSTETGVKLLPLEEPITTLVDVTPRVAELNLPEWSSNKDPLDAFLQAYDVMLEQTIVESSAIPNQKLQTEPKLEPAETSGTPGGIQTPASLPAGATSDFGAVGFQPPVSAFVQQRAIDRPAAELEGVIEPVSEAEMFEVAEQANSLLEDSPIAQEDDLPVAVFRVDSSKRTMDTADGPSEIVPLLANLPAASEARIQAFDATSSQQELDVPVGKQIEMPSPGAAVHLPPVMSLGQTHDPVCDDPVCDDPVCDDPVGRSNWLNRKGKEFCLEFNIDFRPWKKSHCDSACNNPACCAGLRRNDIYYSIFGGGTSVTDLVDVVSFNNIDSESIFAFEDAFACGFAIGQIRGAHLRTELEFSFRSNNAETFKFVQPSVDFDFPLIGELDSFAGMANAYWEFVNFPMRDVKPYVGGGVGFSLFQSNMVYREFPDESVLVDGFESDSAFAYQGMAGVNWCTGPGMSLFVEYRYFGSSPLVYKIDDLVNRFEYCTDNVFVGVRFKF